MANHTLGAGRQDFQLERNGEEDTISDFRTLYFKAALEESQEVPPNNDIEGIDGRGTGTLNLGRTRFEFTVNVDGIDLAGGAAPDDMTDAHIHGAPVGATGPIVFNFLDDDETEVDAAAGTITGGWDVEEEDASDMTPDSLADLLAGDTYFNIHTNRDTSGFIRGQILRDGGAGDRIDLTDLNIGRFDTLKAITSDEGGDAVIRTFSNGEESSLRLDGVSKSELRASHFIFAESSAQTINGTNARDDLFGAGGRDVMNGRAGNDRVFGESGGDTLSGGDGADTLVGGFGLDLLTGGAEADRFVFNRTGESGDTADTADQITDFVVDLDLVVLAAIDARAGQAGNQAFTFVGDDTFDAAGQVRVTHAGGDTRVALNTSGAGGAESIIVLDGNVTLSDDSFVL